MSRILRHFILPTASVLALFSATSTSAAHSSSRPSFDAVSNVQVSTKYYNGHRAPLVVGDSVVFTVNVFSHKNETVEVSLAAEVKRDGTIVADVFPDSDQTSCTTHVSAPFFGCAFKLQAGGSHPLNVWVHANKAGRYCVHLWGYTSTQQRPSGRIALPNKCTYVQ